MKKLMVGLTILLATACGTSKFPGLYRTEDCGDYEIDCFKYYFKTNGNFTYWYSNNTIGEITLHGNYNISDNYVTLKTDKYIFHDSTKIEYLKKSDQNFTNIRICLIPGYLKNKPDTMHIPWLIKINNDFDYDETDDEGNYQTEVSEIKRIEIKDYSAKFELDSNAKITEEILIPEKTNCDLVINLASKILEPIVIPPITKFQIKGKKLIALPESDSSDAVMDEFKPTTNIYIKEKF